MRRTMPIRHQGNENLFLAVEMSLVSTLAGTPLHVHAEGLRGTGKTTVMRWAKERVPTITRIAGCSCQCDPVRPRCPQHAAAAPPGSGQQSPPFSTEEIPMPFIEIGHGAKLGTILGSIDLGRLTSASKPEAVLLPGSIPMANRGIIFIDEVNRLAETAPEITDVLLSVMGTKPGTVKIEEVGMPPFEIEVSASVWAASNPDEDPGPLEDIRKQLADRFDLVVPVQRPLDPAIVEMLLLGQAPEGTDKDLPLAGLAEKAARLPCVKVPPQIVRYVAQLYIQRNVESLRAVEALELSSRLYAAINGRGEVSFDDILMVIPLVLRHRVEPAVLSEILRDLELRRAAGAQARTPPTLPESRCEGRPPGQRRPEGVGSFADGLGKTGEQQGPAAGRPSTLPAEGRRDRVSWFERLLGRGRRNTATLDTAPGRSRQGGAESGARTRSAPRQQLADPATLSPTSPPDRARRIGLLPWEEAVVPPEWKGNSP